MKNFKDIIQEMMELALYIALLRAFSEIAYLVIVLGKSNIFHIGAEIIRNTSLFEQFFLIGAKKFDLNFLLKKSNTVVAHKSNSI